MTTKMMMLTRVLGQNGHSVKEKSYLGRKWLRTFSEKGFQWYGLGRKCLPPCSSIHFAVDHWWSNQVAAPYRYEVVLQKETTSCTCRNLPENSSIRCWTAANASSAEPFRYLACTVSLSRLTHLPSNSSVTIRRYCRGSTLNRQQNQMLRYHARSVGSGTTESVRVTRGSKTQDGTNAIHACCAMFFLFS